MEPRCAVHPDRPAAGTCARCGAFACAEDYAAVAGRWLCATCAARPDSDYLEAFRQKYWGKRDAWGWLMGLAAVGQVLLVATVVTGGQLIVLPLAIAVGAADVCYFLGLRWARAFIFAPVAQAVLVPLLALATVKDPGFETVTAMLAEALGRPLIPGFIALAILLNTRNQLFFRVPVSQVRLKKAWDLYCNNTVARSGFLLSLLGLVVPGVGLLAVVLSLIGLWRVDPKAFPPVGRKRQAIAGIILGVIDTLAWGALLVAMSLRGHMTP